jgi:hypothetical protein
MFCVPISCDESQTVLRAGMLTGPRFEAYFAKASKAALASFMAAL